MTPIMKSLVIGFCCIIPAIFLEYSMDYIQWAKSMGFSKVAQMLPILIVVWGACSVIIYHTNRNK